MKVLSLIVLAVRIFVGVAVVSAAAFTGLYIAFGFLMREDVYRLLLGENGQYQFVSDISKDISSLDGKKTWKWLDTIFEGPIPQEWIDQEHPASEWSIGKTRLKLSCADGVLPKSWMQPKAGLMPELTVQMDKSGRPNLVCFGWFDRGVAFTGPREATICISSWPRPVYFLKWFDIGAYLYQYYR